MHNQVLYVQKIIEILAFAHNKFIQFFEKFYISLKQLSNFSLVII
jgi:hypothetical protein